MGRFTIIVSVAYLARVTVKVLFLSESSSEASSDWMERVNDPSVSPMLVSEIAIVLSVSTEANTEK